MARTRGDNGELAGTFNAETEPTAEMVNESIQLAVSLMRPRLGVVPDAMVDQAQALCALNVAAKVEIANFPEQVETNMSPWRSLVAQYKEELANWDMAARGMEPDSQVAIHSIRAIADYPGYTTSLPTGGNY
jgi:hypothetical protein